jgi:hypothetical protein
MSDGDVPADSLTRAAFALRAQHLRRPVPTPPRQIPTLKARRGPGGNAIWIGCVSYADRVAALIAVGCVSVRMNCGSLRDWGHLLSGRRFRQSNCCANRDQASDKDSCRILHGRSKGLRRLNDNEKWRRPKPTTRNIRFLSRASSILRCRTGEADRVAASGDRNIRWDGHLHLLVASHRVSNNYSSRGAGAERQNAGANDPLFRAAIVAPFICGSFTLCGHADARPGKGWGNFDIQATVGVPIPTTLESIPGGLVIRPLL